MQTMCINKLDHQDHSDHPGNPDHLDHLDYLDHLDHQDHLDRFVSVSKFHFQDKENGVAELTKISLHEQHYP